MSSYRRIANIVGLALMAAILPSVVEAQEMEPESDLTRECRQLAMQSADADKLEDKPLYESNASDYEKGESYELKMNLLGKGNVMYNVTCPIDAEGNMSYEGVGESSSPKL